MAEKFHFDPTPITQLKKTLRRDCGWFWCSWYDSCHSGTRIRIITRYFRKKWITWVVTLTGLHLG